MEGRIIQSEPQPISQEELSEFFADLDKRTSMPVNADSREFEVKARLFLGAFRLLAQLNDIEYIEDTSSPHHFQERHGGTTMADITVLNWMRREIGHAQARRAQKQLPTNPEDKL